MTRLSTTHTVSVWLASALFAGLSAAPAHADMIDHGAFEALFGEPITTSATGQPQRASESPANMAIISAEEIRRSGARDIPGVLRHVGGVDVLEWTNGHTDVSLRGYNSAFSSRLLVLIDGRQVYADHFGFVPWNALPVQMEEIRQIEIVKGPNAALFGFNAVGGVINIVTFNPAADSAGAVTFMAGTQDLIGGSAVATFHLGDRLSTRLSAGAQRADDYETTVPPTLFADRVNDDKRTAVNIDSVLRLSDEAYFRFDASYTKAERNEVAPGIILFGTDYTTGSARGRFTIDTHAGLIQATAYANWIEAVTEQTPVLPEIDFDNRVVVLKIEDLFTIGTRHTFRLAGEYRNNRVNTAPIGGATVSYDVYSGSAMWDWKITPSLSLTNAVRFDTLRLSRDGFIPLNYPYVNSDWDRSIEETSFNTGFVWRASQSDTLRIIASRGAQLPSLTNLGSLLLITPSTNISGAPTVDPSTVTNYEINWDHEFERTDTQFRANVFAQKTQNVINLEDGFAASATAVYIIPANVGESKAFGIEIGLQGTIHDMWRWGVDYRGEIVDDDYAPPFQAVGTTDFEDSTPIHLVTARLGWTRGPWEVDGFVRYQSRFSGVQLPFAADAVVVPIDAYAAVDAHVAYHATERATIAVSGRNLSASPQTQTAGPDIERSVMGTITVRY